MYDRKKLAEKLRLYVICGEGDAPEAVIEKTRAALAGGATAVQLRVKSWTGRETYGTALALKKLCAERGALFVVNDRLDIALAAHADGVHLGQKDLPVDAARAIAGPDFIIGGTARTPELAREAERLGADYVGCGAAFGTATKGDAVVIGPDGIKNTLSAISIPSVAIGGIELSNVRELAGCGASGISLSGAVMRAEDPEAAAGALINEINKYF
ncbi:thiamine phosphate synthase [Cloacibacillus sp. An23]|uniref:thiamine phosphate synthase n=1 Tax=Cloacibacillus sp. An23 TaxID=1965591 RepID=UPI000B373EF3|nr:thiamine phosphate synthase [Cloacibacillus sp. An23]OUO92932.1 thiamine-phosphate diphosphorylase [Cloacibacillus sp. An23]